MTFMAGYVERRDCIADGRGHHDVAVIIAEQFLPEFDEEIRQLFPTAT